MILCPDCDGELREEHTNTGHTGFCQRCLRRYKLCSDTLHMQICIRLKDHLGPHKGKKGTEWA